MLAEYLLFSILRKGNVQIPTLSPKHEIMEHFPNLLREQVYVEHPFLCQSRKTKWFGMEGTL